jgi:hypothetical protein
MRRRFMSEGVHELADRGQHRGDGLVVVLVFAFESSGLVFDR